MSLDPPTYLSSLQNNIRQRPIAWEGAVRAGTITDDQLSKIRAIDKVRKEQRKQTIEDDLDTYRTLFLGGDGKPGAVESAASAKRSDVVQYFLVLLGDLLEGWYFRLKWYQYSKTSLQAFQLSRNPSPNTPTHTSLSYLSSRSRTTQKILNHCSHPPYSQL